MRYNRFHKDNNFLTPTTYTQELSEYAVNLKYEDIPAEVIERAKMIMLQTIGVTLAARKTAIAGKVLEMAREANGGEGRPHHGVGQRGQAGSGELRAGPGHPVRLPGLGGLLLDGTPLRRHHPLRLAGGGGEAQKRQGPADCHCGRLRGVSAYRHGGAAVGRALEDQGLGPDQLADLRRHRPHCQAVRV